MSKYFLVVPSCVTVPLAITEFDPLSVGIATKAIAIATSRSQPPSTEKLVGQLAEWAGMEEDTIKGILEEVFNLSSSSLTNEARIPRPVIKVGKKPNTIKPNSSINDTQFLEQCATEFPVLDIGKNLKLFVEKMRSLGYATSQQGFLNHLRRRMDEEEVLKGTVRTPGVCEICNGKKFISDFIAGEQVNTPCPCSE